MLLKTTWAVALLTLLIAPAFVQNVTIPHLENKGAVKGELNCLD
jgi:hypothetical protein